MKGKESKVRLSGVPGGEARCRGGSGHRVSSLALVAAVLPAVEEKGPFIPTLVPPQPPPTSLAGGQRICVPGGPEGQAQLEGGREGTPPVGSTEPGRLSGAWDFLERNGGEDLGE